MAQSSYLKALFGGLPAEMKAAMHKAAEYLLDRNLEFGAVDTTQAINAARNMRGVYVKVTTAATANQEVAVAHGLGREPGVCWQVGAPRYVNTRFLGDLTFSRAADASRLYLTSASTSAIVYLYVE